VGKTIRGLVFLRCSVLSLFFLRCTVLYVLIYCGALVRTDGRNLEIFKRNDAVSDVGGRNGHKGTVTVCLAFVKAICRRENVMEISGPLLCAMRKWPTNHSHKSPAEELRPQREGMASDVSILIILTSTCKHILQFDVHGSVHLGNIYRMFNSRSNQMHFFMYYLFFFIL
jgi:hypothetical protein